MCALGGRAAYTRTRLHWKYRRKLRVETYFHCKTITLLNKNNNTKINNIKLLSVSDYPSPLNEPEFNVQDHKYKQCVGFVSVCKGPVGASASYNYPQTTSMFTSMFLEVSAPLVFSMSP